MREFHNMMLKLTFLNVLNDAQAISSKTTNLIIFTILSSIPLFFFLVFSENILQTILVEASEMLRENLGYLDHEWPVKLRITITITKNFSYRLIQLSLFYLLPLHLLELCTALVILYSVKNMHTEETPMILSEMVSQSINKARFKGNLITSAYILFLSNSFLLGSIWLATNYYAFLRSFCYNMFLAALYRAGCIGLLVKYLAVSALCNMSIVISVLEEIHGADALMLSTYFIKERKGVLCMLGFFLWEMGLRSACFYTGCNERWWLNVTRASLLCIGNAMKWVVFMIYFYHCRSKILEKDDAEVGK